MPETRVLFLPERSKLPALPSPQSSMLGSRLRLWEDCLGQAGVSGSTKTRGRNVDAAFFSHRECGAVERIDEPVAIEFVLEAIGIRER